MGGTSNDLVTVTGALTLGGTLNINDLGSFGTGVYRLFNYGGTLTNNIMTIGTVPAGVSASALTIQTGCKCGQPHRSTARFCRSTGTGLM